MRSALADYYFAAIVWQRFTIVIGLSLIFIYSNILSRFIEISILMFYCALNSFFLHIKIEDQTGVFKNANDELAGGNVASSAYTVNAAVSPNPLPKQPSMQQTG